MTYDPIMTPKTGTGKLICMVGSQPCCKLAAMFMIATKTDNLDLTFLKQMEGGGGSLQPSRLWALEAVLIIGNSHGLVN